MASDRIRVGVGSFLLALAACGGASVAPAARTEPTAPAAAATAAPPPPAPPNPLAEWAVGAQLYQDLGPLHHEVTTTSPEAQKYFDQGLRLSFGFNYDESIRSFAMATVLDPQCAACFWGAAYELGPNYNIAMRPDYARPAWDALQRAVALAPRASDKERALIAALEKRYPGPDYLDPSTYDPYAPYARAYADAMRGVAARFPDDLDVQVLFASSLMEVHPWDLWTLDGKPAPGTDEIEATLQAVLARDPNHPGAVHFYIHTEEASPHPEKGVAAAERLGGLMPSAGHMVHMPAHIFQRVGRYEEAAEANRRAVAVDQAFMERTKPRGHYAMLLAHNYAFLSFAAAMEGRSEEAIAAARNAGRIQVDHVDLMAPGKEFLLSQQVMTLVRFGKWDEVLAQPRPAAHHVMHTALWLHCQGMAHAAKGLLAEADADLDALTRLAAAAPKDVHAGRNSGEAIFALAKKALAARIAQARRSRDALALWAEAVALEDKLAYSEPAGWFYPTRHLQGAALLKAGKARDAEAVYREDLRRNPANGWSLYGLTKALEAQKKLKEAAATQAQLDAAWSRADVPPTAGME